MFETFCLGVALAVGQGGPVAPQPIPVTPIPAGRAALGDELPRRIPPALPTVGVPGQWAPARTVSQDTTPTTPADPAPATDPKAEAPANGEKKNGENGEKKNGENGEKKEEEKKDDRAYFMRVLDEKYFGGYFKASDIRVDGWLAFSYNVSTRNVTNLPYVWADRADSALLQQFWVNVEKPIDIEKAEVQHGWKVAYLYGSDYRWTLIRGFLNNQLKNYREDPRELNGFEQNLYGSDFPVFWGNVWLPGVGGQGTEVTVGRLMTPFGYESVMAPLTPLMSRSYAFHYGPPFFHVGVMATTVVDKNLIVKNMLANGNDVFFDGSQDWRYVGQVLFTSDDAKSTLAFGTSIGRGRFDAARPNGPLQGVTTIGLAYEPAGRNNINVFDVVYTQTLTDTFSYAFEGIYGYQTNVPAGATGSADNFGGGSGTAHWGSIVNYFLTKHNDKLSSILRLEAFCDAQGQRTGFEGVYYSATFGLQCQPCDELIIRPEVRYDYNPYSRPFTGRHDIFVAGFDMIVKF